VRAQPAALGAAVPAFEAVLRRRRTRERKPAHWDGAPPAAGSAALGQGVVPGLRVARQASAEDQAAAQGQMEAPRGWRAPGPQPAC